MSENPNPSLSALHEQNQDGADWSLSSLPRQISKRQLRLLLAGCSRHLFANRKPLEREVIGALEALEQFADTGKTKAALKEAQRVLAQWRLDRVPELAALHESLEPTALGPALHSVARIIAAPDLKSLLRDLIFPFVDANAFSAEWRTPSVISLAKTMYDSRSFDAMSRLADALEQAGCQSQEVLGHCRDPKARHIRGCWVVDAILDGRWAEVGKAPKGVKKPKTLLSQVPKRCQYYIAKIMEERDGNLSFEEYFAKRWDAERFLMSRQFYTEEMFAKLFLSIAIQNPKWSSEQTRVALALRIATDQLKDVAIARRFTLDAPEQLAQGMCFVNRRSWLMGQRGFWDPGGNKLGALGAFAIRDMLLIERYYQCSPIPDGPLPDRDFTAVAVDAALHRDVDRLRTITDAMSRRRDSAWMQAKYDCFSGVAKHEPDLVAKSLSLFIESVRRLRAKDELEEAVFLEAHGLYRLCEWVSPELVSAFDANQSLPWDSGFHSWTQAHDNPVEGVDLTGVSSILHNTLVRLEPPEWWIPPETTPDEVGDARDMCAVVLLTVGERIADVVNAVQYIADTSDADANRLITITPVVIREGILRNFAIEFKRRLQLAGATAEIRLV